MKMKHKVLRINYSTLEKNNNIYYLDSKLFTGYAYQFDKNGRFVAQWDMQQGQIIAQLKELVGYIDPREDDEDIYLYCDAETIADHEAQCAEQSNIPRFDYANLKRAGDPHHRKMYLDDEVFEGVAYRFDSDGFLRSEAFYDDEGESVDMCLWLASGQLLENYSDYPRKTWHDSGIIKSKEFNKLVLFFTDSGLLYYLSQTEKTAFLNENFGEFTLNQDLTITGQAIDDALISKIFASDNNIIIKLLLRYTNISVGKLLSLDLSCLEVLELDRNYLIDEDATSLLEAEYTECEIIYNK